VANKPENNRANQNTFKARMAEKGMVRLEVWTKKEHIDKVKAYVKSLNDQEATK